MGGINGIPFKIRKETVHGDDMETAYFATARKCPELKGKIKAFQSLVGKVKAISRKTQLSMESIENAVNYEAVDAALANVEKTKAESDALESELEAMTADFIRAGLTGAGYDVDTVDRLAKEIPENRVGELIHAAQLGSGALDFT